MYFFLSKLSSLCFLRIYAPQDVCSWYGNSAEHPDDPYGINNQLPIILSKIPEEIMAQLDKRLISLHFEPLFDPKEEKDTHDFLSFKWFWYD